MQGAGDHQQWLICHYHDMQKMRLTPGKADLQLSPKESVSGMTSADYFLVHKKIKAISSGKQSLQKEQPVHDPRSEKQLLQTEQPVDGIRSKEQLLQTERPVYGLRLEQQSLQQQQHTQGIRAAKQSLQIEPPIQGIRAEKQSLQKERQVSGMLVKNTISIPSGSDFESGSILSSLMAHDNNQIHKVDSFTGKKAAIIKSDTALSIQQYEEDNLPEEKQVRSSEGHVQLQEGRERFFTNMNKEVRYARGEHPVQSQTDIHQKSLNPNVAESQTKEKGMLTYTFSEWGKKHQVNIQLPVMQSSPVVLQPSDALVHQRLTDYSSGQQQQQGQPEWVFQDEDEQPRDTYKRYGADEEHM